MAQTTSVADIKSGNSRPAARTIFQLLDDPRMHKAIGAVAGKYFTPDRFMRLCVNAIRKTPKLAQCDPQSVLGAFMASAALGLEPNTVQQQAFLIPYDKRGKLPNGQWGVVGTECQFQVGYRGFITLAHRSEHIASIQAEAFHEGDLFDHLIGSETFLKYRKAVRDRGGLIGAFCYTRLASGIEMATVLPIEELHKIRSKSETFNALVRNLDGARSQKEKESAAHKLDETPWVMWEDDMSAKSAIKKHAKQLPLTPGDALSAATQLDSDSDTIDLSAMADPDVARGVVVEGYDAPERSEESDEPVAQIEHQQAQTVPQERVRKTEKVASGPAEMSDEEKAAAVEREMAEARAERSQAGFDLE